MFWEGFFLDLFYTSLQNLLDDNLDSHTVMSSLRQQFPNLTYECIKSRVRRYRLKYGDSTTKTEKKVIPETALPIESFEKSQYFEYRKDGSVVFERVIALADNDNITPETILKAHGMDTSKWEILSYKNNFWQSQKKGGQIINLYQSKITAKPIEQSVTIEELEKHFNKFQKEYTTEKVKTPIYRQGHLLYEINICDLHLGRFCYDNETGEPLNSQITKRRFFDVIQEECSRLEKIKDDVDKILFVWTNDFFNSDGMSKATTAGTPQDTDLKWQELYLTGIEMLITAIDMLKNYAPVTTFYIASNHSRQTDFYAINYLNAWFRKDANVDVWINSSPRQYFVYGKTLLGFAHGYYEKKEALPFLMSNECAKDWATTTYREFHLAHFHSEKVEEKGGIVFRWLPSVTSADTWSKDCGYVTATKRSYSFVYDYNKGLIQINSTIVD